MSSYSNKKDSDEQNIITKNGSPETIQLKTQSSENMLNNSLPKL